MSAILANRSKLWTPSRVLLGNFLPLILGILLAQLADTLAATAPNPTPAVPKQAAISNDECMAACHGPDCHGGITELPHPDKLPPPSLTQMTNSLV
jgi:hypothetical protein